MSKINKLAPSTPQETDRPELPDYGMKGRDYSLPFTLVSSTSKNTTIASPKLTSIILPLGRINYIWLNFPKGCAGLVGLQLWRGPNQIFPIPPGIWFTADGFFDKFGFTHVIFTEPFQLTLKVYNLDDTYNHTVTCILEMSGNADVLSAGLQGFLDTLKG